MLRERRDGHRRRNPRGGRRQARLASGAVARAAGRAGRPAACTRIGLSATQKPIEVVAQFLTGAGRPDPVVVQVAPRRALDLAVEVPPSELGPVASQRAVGRDLRPHRGARARASLDAGLRQHAAAGRARRASSRRAAGRGCGRRRTTAACRARSRLDAERDSRPASCARSSRRRRSSWASTSARRSGVPDRIAALDRGRAAAHRPRGTLARRRAEGPVLRDHARRADRMRGAGARDARAASSTAR